MQHTVSRNAKDFVELSNTELQGNTNDDEVGIKEVKENEESLHFKSVVFVIIARNNTTEQHARLLY